MNTNPDNKTQLTEIAKAIGVILGVPSVLFTIVNNVFEQPLISLSIALITAVLVSIWVILSRWVSITEIIIGWLTLAVVVLAGFVIWPRTMTVEGLVYDTTHNPVSNEEVVFFDRSGRRYETKTSAEGYYQFIDVPSGKYRVRVRTNEIEGETKGILVRVVQQNLTVPEITPTPTHTPTPPPHTPVPPSDTPTSEPRPTTPVPEPTDTPTLTPTPKITNTPTPTDTPHPIPTPTATIDADPTVYDNFNNPAFDGKWDTGLWTYSDTPNSADTLVKQEDGILMISRQVVEPGGLDALRPRTRSIDQVGFVEAKLMLDSNIEASEWGDVFIGIAGLVNGHEWWTVCYILGEQQEGDARAGCNTEDYNGNTLIVQYNSWHTIRFEINPDTAAISYFVDGQQIDAYVHADPGAFKKTQFEFFVGVWSLGGGLVTGYIDDVRFGQFEQ